MGMGLTLFWGWEPGAALVFGLALSVASTVVLLRALEARGVLDSINGRIAVGWLVVEDLVMVLVLVLLPPLAGLLGGQPAGLAAAAQQGIWMTLGITFAKIAAFIALMLVVGGREEADGVVAVRSREKGDQGTVPLADFVQLVRTETLA